MRRQIDLLLCEETAAAAAAGRRGSWRGRQRTRRRWRGADAVLQGGLAVSKAALGVAEHDFSHGCILCATAARPNLDDAPFCDIGGQGVTRQRTTSVPERERVQRHGHGMKKRRVRSDEITNYSYLFYLKFNFNLFETRSSSMYLYVLYVGSFCPKK